MISSSRGTGMAVPVVVLDACLKCSIIISASSKHSSGSNVVGFRFAKRTARETRRERNAHST
jgi:hypothetical protein